MSNYFAKRTKKGNVTSTARKKYGMKGGRFPIFDMKSAMSALKLRGHANSMQERMNIINRAAKYAPAAAAKARKADKSK